MGTPSIKGPYPLEKRQTLLSVPKDLSCPTPPAPPESMVFDTIYTDRSDGVSIVDKEAQKRYQKQIKNIRHFETRIVGWSNNIVRGKKGHINYCGLTWMKDWATQNALFGVEESFQGESLRKWALATISTQYYLLKQSVNIPHADKKVTEEWIKTLANQVIADYSRHPDSKSRNNNHLYWAAWGVMAASFAVNEPEYFNWSVSHYKKGVSDIQEDGTLPLELERQGRAFLYHNFALAPLIMMAETAAQNGVDLYGENNGAIHKLVNRIASDLNSKQSYITLKAGKEQDMKGVITSASMAWIAPYHKRHPSDNLEKWIDKYKPLRSSRLGGDLSYLFDLQ